MKYCPIIGKATINETAGLRYVCTNRRLGNPSTPVFSLMDCAFAEDFGFGSKEGLEMQGSRRKGKRVFAINVYYNATELSIALDELYSHELYSTLFYYSFESAVVIDRTLPGWHAPQWLFLVPRQVRFLAAFETPYRSDQHRLSTYLDLDRDDKQFMTVFSVCR